MLVGWLVGWLVGAGQPDPSVCRGELSGTGTNIRYLIYQGFLYKLFDKRIGWYLGAKVGELPFRPMPKHMVASRRQGRPLGTMPLGAPPHELGPPSSMPSPMRMKLPMVVYYH